MANDLYYHSKDALGTVHTRCNSFYCREILISNYYSNFEGTKLSEILTWWDGLEEDMDVALTTSKIELYNKLFEFLLKDKDIEVSLQKREELPRNCRSSSYDSAWRVTYSKLPSPNLVSLSLLPLKQKYKFLEEYLRDNDMEISEERIINQLLKLQLNQVQYKETIMTAFYLSSFSNEKVITIQDFLDFIKAPPKKSAFDFLRGPAEYFRSFLHEEFNVSVGTKTHCKDFRNFISKYYPTIYDSTLKTEGVLKFPISFSADKLLNYELDRFQKGKSPEEDISQSELQKIYTTSAW